MRGIVNLSGNGVAIFRNFTFATEQLRDYIATCTGRCQKEMDPTAAAVCIRPCLLERQFLYTSTVQCCNIIGGNSFLIATIPL